MATTLTIIKGFISIKFSFPKMQNRQLLFSPRKPYDLVAERSEAASSSLSFSKMWTQGESDPRLGNANTPSPSR